MESLKQAHLLVREKYQQGHIKPSTNPWNTPIFVIKKKSGKYRLLHDLRAVNYQMQAMGALQPGMPTPAMIPEGWHILIVDLKDCFFTIPLHPHDTVRFAFTLPALDRQAPAARFELMVLPQGMKNSPTLCQLYVAAALEPVRECWPHMIIHHYMDDILIAQSAPFDSYIETALQQALKDFGLVIAPEKIQRTAPWKYLGWIIEDTVVRPQKLQLDVQVRTLHDAQWLLGDLQWLCPVVGFPSELLEELRPLRRGTDPSIPVQLSDRQQEVIQLLAAMIPQ